MHASGFSKYCVMSENADAEQSICRKDRLQTELCSPKQCVKDILLRCTLCTFTTQPPLAEKRYQHGGSVIDTTTSNNDFRPLESVDVQHRKQVHDFISDYNACSKHDSTPQVTFCTQRPLRLFL